MSKAFTKESDGASPDETAVQLRFPPNTKNYLTPNGAKRLREEMYRLSKNSGTPMDQGRLRYLKTALDLAEVIDPINQTGEIVRFGATVEVRDEHGSQHTYRIVGIDEASVASGSISWLSPIAKALLQTKKGDVISFKTPSGQQELEVLEVRYEAIP